ncbi:PilZ domain-containing protein [Shewanella intestini]|uniref:PilZ domain-containing protein n=1 Tax=Shewanella intestini TaxID=2017544 RepID=A0ABS5HXM5_9GAMM|nr:MULTISPECIES: PilZ domain-containing protein [Shewanella]MBR9726488.1 PilZ domain-containing protein [Shewanella intestini]MRG34946.1 PilZ domain-containing protein [Shewanella sp. XMDDZSB0408]
MTLEIHSALIEQLKPLMMEPDFADLFEQLTTGESNSTRFLIKMELKRITAASTRIIDLRDKSELPCAEVNIANQVHFLDEPAREALNSALPLYHNKYTLGVYEHVMNAHKARRLKAREFPSEPLSPKNQFVLPAVVLGSYFSRSEERMNYSIKIEAFQDGGEVTSGVSLDLSVGGTRVKLPKKYKFKTDKPINIKLLEVSEEFYFEDLQRGVEYQIVDVENKEEHVILRLKRIGGGEQLDKLLGQLIRGYKFRYKVDINNVEVTARGLGHERFYLPQQTHLSLFVSAINGRPEITHELSSRGNQALRHYFLDENNINQIRGLLTLKRLVNVVKQHNNPDHNLLFCFTHNANGRVMFYSASLAELKASNCLPLFLGFSSTKASWRILRVSVQKVDHSKNYKTSTLPGDEQHYSPLVEKQLSSFSHVLQLVDLTNEDIKPAYKKWFNNEAVNNLKTFAQNKINQTTIKNVSMPFSERRKEARFAFKTLVHVHQQGKKFDGITQDISCRGLQVLLDEPEQLTYPAEVHLSFPRLQTMAGKTDLSNQPYQLLRARQNGQTLHLSANIRHCAHNGVTFLNKLIQHNKEKLAQLSEASSEQKELADGMKNLIMRKLAGMPYFIEKTVKSAQMACIGIGTRPDPVSHLFSQKVDNILEYNLTPLLANGVLKEHIIDPIKAMKPNHEMDFFEVFIELTRQARGKITLNCKLLTELASEEEQTAFIHHCKEQGRFIALRVYRGATGKPDMKYIRRELDYINLHAPHRAKNLEEQLWRIIGTGEMIDITSEVELRYPALYIIEQQAAK